MNVVLDSVDQVYFSKFVSCKFHILIIGIAMSVIYIDESIHDCEGFIVTAAVYARESLDETVFYALESCGFVSKVDEFKSSMIMQGNSNAQELRSRLISILMERCKVAVAICSVDERSQLADLSFKLISNLSGHRQIAPGIVYLDEGMKPVIEALPYGWKLETDCDSKAIGGIQLADCAAHTIATILRGEMGSINKLVPTQGSYPETEVDMAWALWTSLRYALSSGEPVFGYDDDGWCEPAMEPFGLLVTEACTKRVKSAVDARLSSVWVGCVQ
jgi:hypothetical protein